MKTPKVLQPALRQYQHNDCSGLIAGFDYKETVEIVNTMEKTLKVQSCLIKENKQLTINEQWLINQIDVLHDLLCPNKVGTWQSRATQVIERVKEITKKDKI